MGSTDEDVRARWGKRKKAQSKEPLSAQSFLIKNSSIALTKI